MTLATGVYTIINVQNRNHAALYNDDDCSEIRAGTDAEEEAGREWTITLLSNSMYLIQNVRYKNYAFCNPLTPTESHPAVQTSLSKSIQFHRPWRIDHIKDNHYAISNVDRVLCWNLNEFSLGTPVALKPYMNSPDAHWSFVADKPPTAVNSRLRPLSNRKYILCLDGSGIYGLSGLIVLDHIMKEISTDRNHPAAPCEAFDLICGASSGGLIALLIGRLGLDCTTAWQEYCELMSKLRLCTDGDHCDLQSTEGVFEDTFKNIVKKYTGSPDTLVGLPIEEAVTTPRKTTKTFVTTMPIYSKADPERIRSYGTPQGELDSSPMGYQWPIQEAARVTCAAHPYSSPVSIAYNSRSYRFRDAALSGLSNPTRLAVGEANGLFGEEKVFVNIGSGHRFNAETVELDYTKHIDLELRVVSMFQYSAALNAHNAHLANQERLPKDTYFRLDPVYQISDSSITDLTQVESATKKWLGSRDGRAYTNLVIQNMTGLPSDLPPPPPLKTQEGYNPTLDDRRPDEMSAYLNEYQVIFLVDDSSSMAGNRWTETRAALCGIASRAIVCGSPGVGIQFLNAKNKYRGIRDATTVAGIFDKVVPRGGTPTGQRLEEILRAHIAELDAAVGLPDYRKIKPLNLIIITDGEASDDPEGDLVDIAASLKAKKHHPNIVGVQFVQIGDDPDATRELRDLTRANVDNMVDTVPYIGPMTSEKLERVLLGTLHPNIRALYRS
ncbi:hypothetical protein AcW1_004251 [Taiwanofungus camphoratus]|nr:hypothetical protein AcV5_000632 [Antrodia cinnamomea]KAI0959428.1 hypothetical protein AcW1_004251 [Antrodia cinnamomea]